MAGPWSKRAFSGHILARTTNGGATWQWVGSPPESGVYPKPERFQVHRAEHSWAVGLGGLSCTRQMVGLSWTQTSPEDNIELYMRRLHAVDFITNQLGWVGGEGFKPDD